jgi:hypothetical protein
MPDNPTFSRVAKNPCVLMHEYSSILTKPASAASICPIAKDVEHAQRFQADKNTQSVANADGQPITFGQLFDEEPSMVQDDHHKFLDKLYLKSVDTAITTIATVPCLDASFSTAQVFAYLQRSGQDLSIVISMQYAFSAYGEVFSKLIYSNSDLLDRCQKIALRKFHGAHTTSSKILQRALFRIR